MLDFFFVVINKGWLRSYNARNAQLYNTWSAGGYNVEHVHRVAMASLVDQIKKSLLMMEDYPVKTVARAAFAQSIKREPESAQARPKEEKTQGATREEKGTASNQKRKRASQRHSTR